MNPQELRLKPLAKSIAGYVVPGLRTVHHANSQSVRAEYAYSVALRHLSRLAPWSDFQVPQRIAEFGLGDALGVGIACLLAGATHYTALDVENHTDTAANLRMFDALVALFRARMPIPDQGLCIATAPQDWAFPAFIEENLGWTLEAGRLRRIRADIVDQSGRLIAFEAPWQGRVDIRRGSLDWIFSHSVLEHVDDIVTLHRLSREWLAQGGLVSHEIDYGSHDLTRTWNGHWTVPAPLWRVLRGKRPFLINRNSHQDHLDAMASFGIHLLEEERTERPGGLSRARFAHEFATMPEIDARTAVALMIARAET